MPFWLSIACLSVFQGALVALPVRPEWPVLRRLRAGGWAAVLPVSILAFVLIARGAEQASAEGLTYLALVAVPVLAALALAGLASCGAARGRPATSWARLGDHLSQPQRNAQQPIRVVGVAINCCRR